MKVVKDFGFSSFTFEGTIKAVDTFTAIHAKLSKRGYGLKLPEANHVATVGLPGVGAVLVHNEGSYLCHVSYVRGPIRSWLTNLLSRE